MSLFPTRTIKKWLLPVLTEMLKLAQMDVPH